MHDPVKTLAQAEQRYRDGEFRQGADLVWQAAYCAIAAEAQQLGVPCQDEAHAYTVAAYLDQQASNGYADHQLYLSLSDVHRRQADNADIPTDWRWSRQDYIDSLPGIRAMIERLPAANTKT